MRGWLVAVSMLWVVLMMEPLGGRLAHDFAVRVSCCVALSSDAVCVRGGCGAR